MPNIPERLRQGYKEFYRKHFIEEQALFRDTLAHGQRPRVLVIACSDSRVDPAVLMQADPGELFVIRNVAGLVPPFCPDDSYHGTSAALEFGVNVLNVDHIIVIGHEGCAGVANLRARSRGECCGPETGNFVAPWMDIAKDAVAHEGDASLSDDKKAELAERGSTSVSLKNLYNFPDIAARIDAGTLTLRGWHFSVKTGKIHETIWPEAADWQPIEISE